MLSSSLKFICLKFMVVSGHARPHMRTGPSVSATQPSLQLFSRRLWNSQYVIAIVHAHPATSPALNSAPTLTSVHLSSVWGGWTLRHTSCGLYCFIAQIAIPLATFGNRLNTHPAEINTHTSLESLGNKTSGRFLQFVAP